MHLGVYIRGEWVFLLASIGKGALNILGFCRWRGTRLELHITMGIAGREDPLSCGIVLVLGHDGSSHTSGCRKGTGLVSYERSEVWAAGM